MNRCFISLTLVISLVIIMELLVTESRLFAISVDEVNTLSDNISNAKNQSEVEKLTKKSDFGRILIKEALFRTFKKKLNKNTTIAIISFLSDPNIQKKYKIGDVFLSSILESVIMSPNSELEMKEYVIKSFDIVPVSLWRFKDYFLKVENQKTQLFKQYVQWCLHDMQNEDVFDFISKIFDKLDVKKQLKFVKKLNLSVEGKDNKQLKLLKKIATSKQYNEKLRQLARQRLSSLKNDNKEFVNVLSKVKTEKQVEEILKKYIQHQSDYKTLERIIADSKSFDTQKAIVEYLAENCYKESGEIGNILAIIVISPKFRTELKKIAMVQDAFTYNGNYKKKLCEYFSKKKNQKSPLYNRFIDCIVDDSNDEESMAFIQKHFYSFSNKEKLKITKNIDLDSSGELKIQFDFFKNILKKDKYSEDLKAVAKEQLDKLNANKKEYSKIGQPRSGKEMVTACVSGMEKLTKKIERRVKKGDSFTKKDAQDAGKFFEHTNKMLELLKTEHKLDDKTMNDARSKLKILRSRINEAVNEKSSSGSVHLK